MFFGSSPRKGAWSWVGGVAHAESPAMLVMPCSISWWRLLVFRRTGPARTCHGRRQVCGALAMAMLVLSNPSRAWDACSSSPSTSIEAEICSLPDLRRLDQALNLVYSLAREHLADPSALRSGQLRWLRQSRDICTTAECLTRAYRKRLSELSAAIAAEAMPSETPMSDAEAVRACSELGSLAGNRLLGALALPAKDADVSISMKELAALQKFGRASLSSPLVAYRVHLQHKEAPALLVSFLTGGTCASAEIFNVSYLLRSSKKDLGLDAFDAADQAMLEAFWGSEDYPILYRGRVLLITADLSNRNAVRMISWLKPDGRRRALCTLSTESSPYQIVSSRHHQLCDGVRRGALLPLEWRPVSKASSADDAESQSPDDFVAARLLDLDGSGATKRIGLFGKSSSAGCGSDREWLSVVGENNQPVRNDPLNELLINIVGLAVRVYAFDGRNYVGVIGGSEAAEDVYSFTEKGLEKVCELSRQPVVSRYIAVEPR